MSSSLGHGTVLAGRYRLDEQRATSLPGIEVWSAVDTILDRPVVVRVLDEAPAAPVLDSARRAALVADPRLVRVLDVGSRDGLGYVVTEQVSGPTLAQLVAREPLSADQARAVVGEAAAALEAARRRGVHHLALAPSAVSVAPDGRVLVSGLALDAVLLGRVAGDARSTSRADAVDLVRLVYAALTGRWPGPPETSGGLPAAPVVAGSVVPPGQLVAGVPPDLDTLCAVTFGPHEDGPHSPGEVVRELEPWGDIRVSAPVRTAGGVPGGAGLIAGSAAAGAAAAAAAAVAARLPASAPPAPAGPPQVTRHSVRAAFDGPTAGTNRPGTPPPAAPGRTGAFPAVPGAGGAAYPPPVFPPPTFPPVEVPPVAVPPPAHPAQPSSSPAHPAQPSSSPGHPAQSPARPAFTPQAAAALPPVAGAVPPDDPFEFGRRDDEPGGRRLSTSGIVMIVVVLAVLVGLGLAVRALLGGNGSAEPGPGAGTTRSAGPSASVTPSTAGPTTGSSTAPTSAATAPTGGAPRIIGITSINPLDAAGEHQEAVGKAIDGDPATFWYSMTYKRDDFGGLKNGVGLALTLPDGSLVRTVTLHVNGSGGNVEIRSTGAAAPTAGPVLASGPLETGTFTLDPATTTSSLVLWFTRLPTTADGSFRIELTEITLG